MLRTRWQVPQLVLNYRTGSADGISLSFLFVWLVGDVTNLSGKLASRAHLLDCPSQSKYRFYISGSLVSNNSLYLLGIMVGKQRASAHVFR